MFRHLASKIKQFMTAVALLLLAIIATEIVLQIRNPAAMTTVAPTVPIQYQAWLAPSATVHHELIRLNRPQHRHSPLIATNSLGMRSPEPIPERKSGTIRILLLGDETILGPELETKHTVSARLQEFLTQVTNRTVEVLNAGVPGYCPLLCWLRYQHELRQLQPDAVVLHFDMSDIADDMAYRKHLKTSDRRQICVNPNLSPESRSSNVASRIFRESAIVRLLKRESGLVAQYRSDASIAVRYAWTRNSSADLRLAIKHALAPLDKFKAAATKGGFQLLISSSPLPWQISDASLFPDFAANLSEMESWPVGKNVPFRILDAVCRKTETPFCNTSPAFRACKNPAALFSDKSPALSAYGAALYAREIASMLLSEPHFANLFSTSANVSGKTQVIN